jgi:hypothetical protein
MNANEILQEIQSHNVTLKTEGETLAYKPRGALPESLIREMKANKEELIQFPLLQQQTLRVYSRILSLGRYS